MVAEDSSSLFSKGEEVGGINIQIQKPSTFCDYVAFPDKSRHFSTSFCLLALLYDSTLEILNFKIKIDNEIQMSGYR